MYDNDYADEIVDQLRHGPYQLSPAEEGDFRWIAFKAMEIYGSDDAIPLDVKLSWFRQNPTGFWMIKHNSGCNIGSCELLPLKKPVINKIIDGMIKEIEVLPRDIYSPHEIVQADCLYIENVMALKEDNTPNQWAFKECLTEMPNVIKYMRIPLRNTKVYAMPIGEIQTDKGICPIPVKIILRRLGFWKVTKATKQGYPFYCAELEAVLSSMAFCQDRFRQRHSQAVRKKSIHIGTRSEHATTSFRLWENFGDACFVVDGERIYFNYKGKLRDLHLRNMSKAHELIMMLLADDGKVRCENLRDELCSSKTEPYDFVRNINRQLNKKIASFGYCDVPNNVEFIKYIRRNNEYCLTIPIKFKEKHEFY